MGPEALGKNLAQQRSQVAPLRLGWVVKPVKRGGEAPPPLDQSHAPGAVTTQCPKRLTMEHGPQ